MLLIDDLQRILDGLAEIKRALTLERIEQTMPRPLTFIIEEIP